MCLKSLESTRGYNLEAREALGRGPAITTFLWETLSALVSRALQSSPAPGFGRRTGPQLSPELWSPGFLPLRGRERWGPAERAPAVVAEEGQCQPPAGLGVLEGPRQSQRHVLGRPLRWRGCPGAGISASPRTRYLALGLIFNQTDGG